MEGGVDGGVEGGGDGCGGDGGRGGGGGEGSDVQTTDVVSVCALLYARLGSCFQLQCPVSDQLTKARDSQQPAPLDSQNEAHASAVSMPPYTCAPINPCHPPPPLQTYCDGVPSMEGQPPGWGAAHAQLV